MSRSDHSRPRLRGDDTSWPLPTRPLQAPRSTWGADLLASVVVFLVALPLCMGISIASGMPPTAGLITGIVGGLIVGFLAGSPLQVSGPAAGLSVLVLELVEKHGVEMIGVIVLFAGLMQFVAGQLKLGQWFRAVSPAVIHGMLAGIGILILVCAVPRHAGRQADRHRVSKVYSAFPACDHGGLQRRRSPPDGWRDRPRHHRRDFRLGSVCAEEPEGRYRLPSSASSLPWSPPRS